MDKTDTKKDNSFAYFKLLKISSMFYKPFISVPIADGDDNHCSLAKPCPLGEGDCDSDDECQGDLVCGYKNCDGSQYGANDDCCKGGKL